VQYDFQIEKLIAAKNKYDEAFFENNALILSKTITRPSGLIKLSLGNIYVSENKLYIVVRTDVPMVFTNDMQYTTLGFVVDKNTVANIDEVITLE
jgi:hypothetical protein